ncbi:hypothetical protein [Burkholderia stagnalis]|uniref:hypothetical protein n=1 Tax=Burkholderia stagnalis TaxID=1503054 RepID=UPI00325B1DC6
MAFHWSGGMSSRLRMICTIVSGHESDSCGAKPMEGDGLCRVSVAIRSPDDCDLTGHIVLDRAGQRGCLYFFSLSKRDLLLTYFAIMSAKTEFDTANEKKIMRDVSTEPAVVPASVRQRREGRRRTRTYRPASADGA